MCNPRALVSFITASGRFTTQWMRNGVIYIMISSYRLGDLVLLDLGENERNKILMEHPNSIGSKYILEKRKNPGSNNIDLIDDECEEALPLGRLIMSLIFGIFIFIL